MVTDFGLLVEHLDGKTTVRMKNLLDGTANLNELSEVGIRVEVQPDPDPCALSDQNGCMVRLYGRMCKVVIQNKNSEYSSDGLGYSWSEGAGTYIFRFDEELDESAKVRFEYGLGVRALIPIRNTP